MRNISCTFNVDGIPTKLMLRKVAKERRFMAFVDGVATEYIISDHTNEIEYYDGPPLNDFFFERVRWLIKQYFPNVKAIVKIGEDDYEDYDDY
ncbi:hypothetical protein [Chitinophaga vietnamensis]|uniref:hypothetical protein n=1 Tax=Chitinophaga vietnamensis TaxID=2593957 RepID=UPI001178946D|nr:hypothetical protein [Chitinophaga vietnamensis]